MRYVCLTVLLAIGAASPVLAADILLPSGVILAPGDQVAFPVTLAKPAPADGVFISLSSSDPSKVSVSPSFVFIPQGLSTTYSPVRITGVGLGTASVSAMASNLVGDTEPVLVSNGSPTLSFSPGAITLAAGGTQNVLLSLSTAAPAGGLFVNLVSSNPGVAQVQPAVSFFPDGSSQATSLVPVRGIAPGTVTIHASGANIPDTTLLVTVLGPGAISLPAGIVVTQNQSVAFPFSLTAPAPVGGVTVTLTSSDSGEVVVSPGTVFVAGGASAPVTQPQITGVAAGSATIGAAAPGYVASSQTVQVQAVQGGTTLSFSPTTLNLIGSGTGSLQLSLSSPAPAGGLTVILSSSNPGAVTVPASATVAANTSSVNIPVTAVSPGIATISASSNAPNVVGATASVVVGASDIILPSGLTLLPGEQQRIRVTLANASPSGGVFVSLSTSDSSKLTVSPASIFIPQGFSTAPVQPILTGVDFGSATLIATASGLNGDSETVRIGTALGFSPPSLAITGVGTTQSLVLNLPGPAPAGGLTVALSSSNPGVATVPAGAVIPANVSSLIIPVTSVGAGSAVIHASAPPNLPDTTATVTVLTSAMIGLPSGVSIGTGHTVSFPVTLGVPAPAGGVTITVVSSDTTKIVVSPATVYVPQGATTPLNFPQLTANNIGTVTIVASAPGYATGAQNVQATATVVFSPSAVTIPVNGFARVLLSLSSAAPPGTSDQGRCEAADTTTCSITVNLRSDNTSVAIVQPSISFFPDGSSQAIVQLPISALSPGTTVIHAGAPPYIPDATIVVTVQ